MEEELEGKGREAEKRKFGGWMSGERKRNRQDELDALEYCDQQGRLTSI